MASRSRTVFTCQSCGFQFPKWQGQCSGCGGWNTLVETVVARGVSGGGPEASPGAKSQILASVNSASSRSKSGIFEFDRVFGGGIVSGSINLVAGEPGVGKSTLLLEVAAGLSKLGLGDVLYVCGEESPEQIKSRAERLGIRGEHLRVFPETNVDRVVAAISDSLKGVGASLPSKQIVLVIVDSIQTLQTEDLTGGSGSIGQVRECAERLRRVAKTTGVPIILVGHLTKSGAVAGPKVLEHLVDGVFSLEGDRFHTFRILRSAKNRFGPTSEVGVFEMSSQGLVEVGNPSQVFLSERNAQSSGSVVVATLEGTRPVLVEIQALSAPSEFRYPRRIASGFSGGRLSLLCAVLDRRAGLNLQDKDLYVNVASGLWVSEPGADLGVILAIASVIKNQALPPDVCAFGEVGLSGELRRVSDTERRSSEAKRLGFPKVICPPGIKTVAQALTVAGL